MKIIIYTRVSDPKQARSGLGLAAQLATCQRWAADHELEVRCAHSDEGITGTHDDGYEASLDKRPGLLAALTELQPGDVLLVARRDRLFRGDPVMAAILDRLVAKQGARIVSAAGEGTDDDSPAQVLFRRILDAIGEYEVAMTRLKTSLALKARKRAGRHIGAPGLGERTSAPDPVTGQRTLVAVPEEIETVHRMVGLREQGWSLRAIAGQLTEEGRTTKRGGRWWAATVKYTLDRRRRLLPASSEPR